LFKVALSTITLTPQFSTNTRRKTLFIYSMCVEKKNGSLQKMNKTKIEKYRRKNKFYWWRKMVRIKPPTCRNLLTTFSHNVVSSTPRLSGVRAHNVSGDIN
jgi:bisphosphoglycerate-dependent phosphoglycerate mutase